MHVISGWVALHSFRINEFISLFLELLDIVWFNLLKWLESIYYRYNSFASGCISFLHLYLCRLSPKNRLGKWQVAPYHERLVPAIARSCFWAKSTMWIAGLGILIFIALGVCLFMLCCLKWPLKQKNSEKHNLVVYGRPSHTRLKLLLSSKPNWSKPPTLLPPTIDAWPIFNVVNYPVRWGF